MGYPQSPKTTRRGLRLLALLVLAAITAALSGCGEEAAPAENLAAAPDGPAEAVAEQEAMPDEAAVSLTSPAFEDGGSIPGRYTCDGADISPALAWSGLPAGTASLVLILDDPDAPGRTWDHWLIYNLDPALGGLPEGAGGEVPDGALQGRNSWRRNDYGGPCPPSGEHRYFFRLYALDGQLDLAAGADKSALLAAMEGHILGQAELVGRYLH